MTETEVIKLLAVITAYDRRTTGESELRAWSETARREHWTFEQARDAVQAHYAESTEWLMPAHVTRRIRQQHAQPPPARGLPRGSHATDEHRARVIAWLADQLTTDREPRAERVKAAYTVECPYCGAAPEQRCYQTVAGTGRPRTPEKRTTYPHTPRTRAAQSSEGTEQQ